MNQYLLSHAFQYAQPESQTTAPTSTGTAVCKQRPTLLHLEKGSSRLFLLDLCNIRHTNSYIIHLSMYLFTQEAFIDVPLYTCIFRDAEMVATMNKRQIPCPCGAHILMG